MSISNTFFELWFELAETFEAESKHPCPVSSTDLECVPAHPHMLLAMYMYMCSLAYIHTRLVMT